MQRRPKPRRGVVLLIVVSLLVLFVLIAVTYAIVAGQYKQAATATAKAQALEDDPRDELDRSLYLLLRDTTNPRSSLIGHSLLNDLYGEDFVIGEVTGAVDKGQFIEINFATLPSSNLSRVPHYYNGSIFTMRSGPFAGRSARVTSFDPTIPQLRIERPDQDDPSANWSTLRSGTFVINGKPFNGTGFGFAGNSFNIDATDSQQRLTCLMPHFSAYFRNPFAAQPTYPYSLGGADESWDTFDFQNMALAMLPPTATHSNHIYPSFHRPDLIKYWLSNNPAALSDPNVARRIMFRPIGGSQGDHPDFDGSNPSFHPINGPWDVDNDNDMVPDSIWIDPGLPVITARNGRSYKRLIAVLCKDLDSCVNVNAQGNRHQTDPRYSSSNSLASVVDSNFFASGTGGKTSPLLPRGLGFGPAEINPAVVFGSEFTTLLSGRYGPDGVPGLPGEELLSAVKQTHNSLSYWRGLYAPWPRTSEMTPGDLPGVGAIGVDYGGIPVFAYMGTEQATIDDGYEARPLDVAGDSHGDTLYTFGELERVLRFNDHDASELPDGLLTLRTNSTATTFLDTANRKRVTVAGNHISTPTFAVPDDVRANWSAQAFASSSLLDLFVHKLTLPQGRLINDELSKMVPTEILHGERFDLNRWFGNGEDDAVKNFVVDEPSEFPQPIFGGGAQFGGPNRLSSDLVSNDGRGSRHLYARHLYCLAMFLKRNNVEIDFDGNANNNTPQETAQGLAQWAINVVDFRDADSIMTAFEYDPNPFNGWDTDGSLASTNESERAVVWGVERPELLLTEAVALHDRRTEDLDSEAPNPNEKPKKTTDPDPNERDTDFDQRLLPRPSLFIELFNPWQDPAPLPTPGPSLQTSSQKPIEFYDQISPTGEFGKELNVRLNSRNKFGSPVWRILLRKGAPANPDQPGFAADRSIYFVPVTAARAAIVDSSDGEEFGTNLGVQPLMPGGYAVIGSSGHQVDGNYEPMPVTSAPAAGRRWITPLGRLSGASDSNLQYSQTRRIELVPSPDFTNVTVPRSQARVLNNQSATAEPDYPNILPAIAIAINQPRSLNVSDKGRGEFFYNEQGSYDPMTGLPVYSMNYDGAAATNEGAFTKPLDTPLDANSDVMTDERQATYCWAYLQRLADPLSAWHPTINPYRTIDAHPVSMNSFNGVTSGREVFGGQPVDPIDAFQSSQRGDDSIVFRNVWTRSTTSPDLPLNNGSGHVLNYSLTHSLGFANRSNLARYGDVAYPAPASADILYWNGNSNVVSRYLGAPALNDGPPGNYAPPFPWLVWNNRPFAAPFELLQVPAVSSAELTGRYSTRDSGAGVPYSAATAEFHHLLNFFGAASTADVCRILDYVGTPSTFVGTEKWYHPAIADTSPGREWESFRPPFNRLSSCREPGRINLNTLVDEKVWQSLMFGYPDFAATGKWSEFTSIRRGPPSGSPTDFGNPLRAAASFDLMPQMLRQANASDATLLVKDPAGPSPWLAARQSLDPNSGNVVMCNDSDRSSFSRYLGLQRLANLTTTHSNVYAIWITVGYFEVSSVSCDEGHPDGWRLGRELGSESGEVQRHRAFYLIDRSIPVAFEPGQDHNVDRTILLRRFIE